MSTHPNAMLICRLTPDGTSRKTMREILAAANVKDDDDITIGGEKYHHLVMEDDYDEGFQVAGKEGDLVFFDMVTYGYGEKIEWDALQVQKEALEVWAKEQCDKHGCQYTIEVGANYW